MDAETARAAAPWGERKENRSGFSLWPEVPGVLPSAVVRKYGEDRCGPKGNPDVQAAHQDHDQTSRREEHVPGGRTNAKIFAWLESLFPLGSIAVNVQKPGFMDSSSAQGHLAQTVAHRDDRLWPSSQSRCYS